MTDALKAGDPAAREAFERAVPGTFSPRWIPVGESMPEAGKDVLAFVVGEHNKDWTRRIRAMWCPRYTIESGNEDECNEYHEERDQYYLLEGWYEHNEYDECSWRVNDPVTHWTPLPPGPGEPQTRTSEGTQREALVKIAEVGVSFAMDGDKVCATFNDFTDLMESPAGFGDTNTEALFELLKAAGYAAQSRLPADTALVEALKKAANDMDDLATDASLMSVGRMKAQLREAAKEARAALQARPVTGTSEAWIDAKVTLPPKDKHQCSRLVLATDGKRIADRYYNYGAEQWDSDGHAGWLWEVTHWRERPALPAKVVLAAGRSEPKAPAEMTCTGCDGCGWCEGSPAFTCPDCKGKGTVPQLV